MIHIAICDNDLTDLKQLKSAVQHIMNKYLIQFDIEEFDSGEKLLKASRKFDLVFLEIMISKKELRTVHVEFNNVKYVLHGIEVEKELLVLPIDDIIYFENIKFQKKIAIVTGSQRYIYSKTILLCSSIILCAIIAYIVIFQN